MELTCDMPGKASPCETTKLRMGALLGAVAALMLLGLTLAASPQQAYAAAAPPAPIYEIFPDEVVADAVAHELGVDVASEVSQDDLDGIAALRQMEGVRDLTGIDRLSNLLELDIEEGKFELSLQEVAAFAPKLERLALMDSMVTGDLKQLSGFADLAGINLSLCEGVTGDVADLATSMPKATVVNFASTAIGGSLSSLADHPNKKRIAVLMLGDMEALEGTLEGLEGMTSLETLDVSLSGRVGGGIDAIKNLPLTGLGITATGVTGDVSSLGSMTSLTRIDANDTAITGDIAAFAGLDELESLSLDNTGVSGTIGSLSGLEKLRFLTLASAQGSGQVTGKLDDLTGVKLRLFDLKGQPVGGSLAALEPIASGMQAEVCLNDTKVSGTLDDLMGSAYNILGLANTDVSGDLSAFRAIEAQTVWSSINLTGTNVTGDIAAFKGYDHLASLSVSNTGAHGSLSDLPDSSYLVAVNAANTALAGSLDELNRLGNLNFLDLSGCANVKGRLEALADNMNLNQVKLSGTGVSGDVNALAGLEYLTLLELFDLAVTLDPLSFDGEPITVDIPVLFKGEALEPDDFTGSTAVVNGNQLTWAVPEALSGTLGYSFAQNIALNEVTVGYSGTVSQAYESKIVPVPTPVPVHFSGGSEHVKGSGKDLVFVVEKDFAEYEKGAVDSVAFTSGMASVTAGSTVATIHASYLDTLGAGKHTVTLFFKDGTSYSGDFTVKASGGGVIVKTGDAPLTLALGAFGGLAVLAALLVSASRRNVRRNNG